MHTQYRPLRLNVGFLLSQTAGYGRQFDFREEKLNLGGDLQVEAFRGGVMLSRTGQGIVAQGDFTAELPAECARCLRPFSVPVNIHLEDLFVYPPQNATDPLLSIGEDAHLNLEPLLREYILINQPTRPLHDPECKGLCTICGVDLNDEPNHRHKEDSQPVVPERVLVHTSDVKPKTAQPEPKQPLAAASKPAGKAAAQTKKAAARKLSPAKRTAPAKKSSTTASRKKTTGGKIKVAGKKSPPGAKKKNSTKK